MKTKRKKRDKSYELQVTIFLMITSQQFLLLQSSYASSILHINFPGTLVEAMMF